MAAADDSNDLHEHSIEGNQWRKDVFGANNETVKNNAGNVH